MKVSVITRTKNRPLLLPRALESIAAQDYRQLEWIVVNDGGERGHVDAIERDAKSRNVDCKVIHNAMSLGMEAASNIGVASSSGSFIAVHDDDDSWDRRFLSVCVGFLEEKPEHSGVVTLAKRIVEKIEPDDKVIRVREELMNPHLESICIGTLALKNQFPPISFLFTRQAYDSVGGFSEHMTVLGDWDFNLRILMAGEIGVVREPMANQHIRVPATESSSNAYGNTVTFGLEQHHRWESRYRNEMFRKDIENGQIGLGWLLVNSQQIADVQEEFKRLRSSTFLAKLHTYIRNIAGKLSN